MSNMDWIDNADSYICPVCRLEVNSPAKSNYQCPRCGFIAEKDKNRYNQMRRTSMIKEVESGHLVEVVRCLECKYRFKNNGHDKSGCPIIDTNIWMDDDDFCSHGERKEGAE